MLTKEQFIDMIKTAEQLDAEIERWGDFGIDLFEMPVAEISWEMFHIWQKTHFNSDGVDWISWYIWERKSINTGEILACYHEDGTEFYVNTPADLWDIVKDYLLKPCVDSSCIFNGVGPCTGL